jgi:hypothetical protein
MHSCALILGEISTSLVRVSTYGGCGGGGGGGGGKKRFEFWRQQTKNESALKFIVPLSFFVHWFSYLRIIVGYLQLLYPCGEVPCVQSHDLLGLVSFWL